MWTPDDVSELYARLRAGTLEETATFDGKREIPEDATSTAVDVCAMTVQGGVILYGVGEDPAGTRLEKATPIALDGARERVAQIVETSIAEPPQISLRTLEEPGQPGRGYLVVVPPSPRAPHQIVAKGKYEGRFYGRGATGNRILTEAEVGALFARRERWNKGTSSAWSASSTGGPSSPSSATGAVSAKSSRRCRWPATTRCLLEPPERPGRATSPPSSSMRSEPV